MTNSKTMSKKKKVLLVGSPLPPRAGLEVVVVDKVLQYRAKWWMYYLPKWIVRIIGKTY